MTKDSILDDGKTIASMTQRCYYPQNTVFASNVAKAVVGLNSTIHAEEL